MALIVCPECGKQFSDKAKACPKCGCPKSVVDNQIKCVDCGKFYSLEQEICPFCGCPKDLSIDESNKVQAQPIIQSLEVPSNPIDSVEAPKVDVTVLPSLSAGGDKTLTVDDKSDKSNVEKVNVGRIVAVFLGIVALIVIFSICISHSSSDSDYSSYSEPSSSVADNQFVPRIETLSLSKTPVSNLDYFFANTVWYDGTVNFGHYNNGDNGHYALVFYGYGGGEPAGLTHLGNYNFRMDLPYGEGELDVRMVSYNNVNYLLVFDESNRLSDVFMDKPLRITQRYSGYYKDQSGRDYYIHFRDNYCSGFSASSYEVFENSGEVYSAKLRIGSNSFDCITGEYKDQYGSVIARLDKYYPTNVERYPFTAIQLMNPEVLRNRYSSEELLIMRNEIFARHGYIFKVESLKNYFSSQSWYSPLYDNVDNMLNEVEKLNVLLIKSVEDSKF